MDANHFISEEVRKSMLAVCENGPEGPVLNNLMSFHQSKSLAIKVCICHILERLAHSPRFFPKESDRVLRMLNSLMGEACS